MEWMTPGPEPIKAKPVPTQGPQGAQGVQGAPVAPAPKPQQGAQGPQGVTRQPTGAQGAQGQVQAQYEHNLLTPQGVQDAVNKGQIKLTTDQLAAYREDKWQALPGSADRVQQTYVAPSWKDGKYQGGYYTSEYVEPGKALVLLKRGNVWLTTDEQEAAKAQIAHLNKEYHDYKQSYAIGTVLQKSPELKHYPGILSAMMQGTTITSKNVKTYGAIGAVFDKFPALAANPRVLGALMSGQNLTRELLLQNNIPAERVNMILEAQKTYRGFVVPEHEVAGILKAQSLYTMSLESMKNYGDYVDFLIKTEPHPGLLQELGHAVQSGIAAIPGGLAVENAVISAVGGILGLMNAHPLMWLDHLLHSEQNKISKEGGGTPLAATTPVLGVATTALDMVTGLFNSTQHFYRTYETIKNTRGEAAALEALMPSVLGAGVGMAVGAALTAIPGTEELAPGELAATGAGLDSSLAAADAAGAALDMSRFTKAVQELRDSANALKDLVKMPFESLSKTEAYQTFLRAKASVETLLRPFVDVVRPVTDVTGKVINKYSIAGWQIGADIGGQTMYRKEWAETADATKWAKDHPNEAPTLGQALLGRHNFASGAVDFLISVGAQDPYAVVGSFRKDIRSVEGLTFNLHLPFIDKTLNHVWSGTAFANVDQAYEQYAGVRRALNAIVANVDNVAAINRIDKRLAPIAPLLHAAKADTPEETLRNVMDVFKNLSAVDEVFTTGKLPMTSSMLLRLRQMEVGSKGRFTFMPMFLDFSGKVQDWGVRNRDFTLGDSGALPALAHGLEQIGIPRSVVDEAINHLASTKDPGEWMNTYKTVVKGHLQLQMVATLVGDKLAAEFDPVVLDSFLAHFDAQVNEAVDRAANLVTGFGGISTKEHAYAYGRDGMNLSHATDGVKEASAAVYESQVGRIHFPNYNEFRRSTHGLVRALKNSSSVKQLDVSLKKLLSQDEYEAFVAAVSEDKVSDVAVEFREHRTDLGISKELSGKFVQNLRYAWDTTKGGSGVMKDFIDRYVNDNYFKPMALATGGWATRVSASEIMLNAMRQGPINLSLARFAAAGARHERAVLHWGKDLERKSIMDIAARVAYVLGGKFVDPNHRVFSSNEEMGHFVAVLHGVMAGVETSILKGLGKQEFMDAAIRSLYLNQGHLAPQMVEGGHAMVNDRSLPAKGSIMSVDTALSAEKDTAEGVRAMKAKMEQIVGHKARLSTSGEFTGIGSGNQGFIVSRLFQADTQATDKSVHYALQEMVRVFDEEIKAGKSVEQAWESAKVEGIGAHYEFMQSLPQSTREIMVRQKNFVPTNTEFLKKYPYATDDPGLAHSAVAIEGLESTLWGGRNLPATGKPYFDERLFKDMAARTIKDKSWQEFARAYHTGPDGERLGSEHFSMVFGPKVNHITFSELLPTHASEWLNTKFTSRIVSRLSREPIFIVEFAKQRKIAERELASKLGEAVDDEAATLMQDRSEAMAMARASMEMVRYIHNPYDKLKFEYGMRVIAPFYFAQNQSWRRMGRLLVEDPGAFERYAKLVMQTLNFSYAASKSTGGYPTITMPFSGSIMGFVTKMLDGGVAVPIGIPLSLSSAQSILPISPLDTVEPTNALSSPASLVHSLIPRFGPVFNLPLKWILPSFGVLTPLELQKINDTIVGATGESTSLVQDAVPNSFIDHMLQTSIGVLGAVWSKPGQNINSQFLSSYITASDETWRYIIEKKFDQLEATVRAASKGKSDNYINNLVLQNFQQFYSPGTPEGKKHLSDLFSEVNKATATRAVVRAVVGFMSPLSTSMGQANQQFTQDYQNLVYLLNGDTMAAQDKLLSLNPDRAPYTIATTASKSQGLMAPGTSWPTTQNGLHWMEANTGIVSAYPSASRYLMPIATLESSKNPYDALAQLYQIQQQFREKRTPADMMTALNISVGNYFFNQVVLPTYENYFKSQGVSDPAYSAYAQGGKQWIQSTGSVLNPDWVAYHGAAEGKQFRTQTLDQVKNLIADPKYAKMPQMQNLRNVYDSYVALDAEMTQMNYTSSQKGAAWNGKGGVVDQMKKLVPSMVPFITDVLAPLYPYYPNG